MFNKIKRGATTSVAMLAALIVAFALAIAGCGGGSSSSGTSSPSTVGGATTGTSSTSSPEGAPKKVPALTLEPGPVDWPFFGRVPQRTHYLPANRGVVDRP